eukprot:scaffold10764_cov71-Phaeocystis_antarctica.AAC.2
MGRCGAPPIQLSTSWAGVRWALRMLQMSLPCSSKLEPNELIAASRRNMVYSRRAYLPAMCNVVPGGGVGCRRG